MMKSGSEWSPEVEVLRNEISKIKQFEINFQTVYATEGLRLFNCYNEFNGVAFEWI